MHAETAAQPKWELGLGVGALTTADYVGSDERQQVVLPAPYVVYRGERVQADRGGLRSTLFEAGPLELKLSLSATPPVRTNDNNERKDMPDLDPSFEVGPELRWHIWESASERVAWDVRVPLRFVYAVGDGRVHSIGTAVSPMLSVDVRDVFHQGWKFGLNAGPVFTDRSLNDYYYGVGGQYATAVRPAYAADSGYAGMQLTSSLTRRRGNWWVGGYLQLRSIDSATFEDSPLVEQSGSAQAGVAFAYVFARSSRLVDVGEDD